MNSLIVQDTKDGAILTFISNRSAFLVKRISHATSQTHLSVTRLTLHERRFTHKRSGLVLAEAFMNNAGRTSARAGKAMRHRGLSLIWGLLMLAACSTAQPILYPNTHLQSVGKEIAAQDIEACRKLAESAGAEGGGTGKAGRVATSTAVGGGVGAAAGAVGGAISGSVGYGSMIGAATGAVWGFLMGLFRESRSSQQNQAYTNFVNRCLQEKGYEVTGWQ